MKKKVIYIILALCLVGTVWFLAANDDRDALIPQFVKVRETEGRENAVVQDVTGKMHEGQTAKAEAISQQKKQRKPSGGVIWQKTGEQASSAAAELVTAKPSETRFVYRSGNVVIGEMETPAGRRSWVDMTGCWPSMETGKPALPRYRVNLAKAKGKPVRLVVRYAEWEEVPCAAPQASAGLVTYEELGREATEETAVYGGGGVWPAGMVRLEPEYAIRGVELVGVTLMPAAYDFERGVMRICRECEIDVETEDAEAEDYGTLDGNRDFAQLQTRGVLNAELLQVPEEADGAGHLLVIAPDEWLENVAGYAAWKRRLGYRVVCCGYPQGTGSGVTGVQGVIQRAYRQDGLTAVMIIGGDNDVPSAVHDAPIIYVPNAGTSLNDPYVNIYATDVPYTLLEGDDNYADVLLGRLPVRSATEAERVLAKLQDYESQNADDGLDDSWRSSGLFIASEQNYGAKAPPELRWKKDSDVMAEAVSALQTGGIMAQTTELYTNATCKAIQDGINAGVGFVGYLGHGHNDYWTTGVYKTEHAAAATNGLMLPLVASFACKTGNFGYTSGDCLAAALVQSPGGGACGALAATNETFYLPPVYMMYCLHEAMGDMDGDTRLVTQGAYAQTAVNGGVQFCETTGAIYLNSYAAAMAARQFQLFGDCLMGASFRQLRALECTVTRDVAAPSVRVQTLWRDTGEAMPAGTRICVRTTDGAMLASGFTGTGGRLTLRLPEAGRFETLEVVVSDPLAGVTSQELPRELDEDGDGEVSEAEVLEYLSQGEAEVVALRRLLGQER